MTSGCDSILERPELTKPLDETYGKTDNEYRLYVNEAYPVYFVGYNNSWGSAYAPLRGYNFSDDNASSGKQTSFENTVPTSAEVTTPVTSPTPGFPNTQPATGTLPGYANGI